MKKSEQVKSWAVYQITLLGVPGPNVVCQQSEWDALEQAQPGQHRLVRGRIANEGEAERLARGTSGDTRQKSARKKSIFRLLAVLPDCVIEPYQEPDNGDGQEEEGPVLLPFPAPQGENSEPPAPDEPDGRMQSA